MAAAHCEQRTRGNDGILILWVGNFVGAQHGACEQETAGELEDLPGILVILPQNPRAPLWHLVPPLGVHPKFQFLTRRTIE